MPWVGKSQNSFFTAEGAEFAEYKTMFVNNYIIMNYNFYILSQRSSRSSRLDLESVFYMRFEKTKPIRQKTCRTSPSKGASDKSVPTKLKQF